MVEIPRRAFFGQGLFMSIPIVGVTREVSKSSVAGEGEGAANGLKFSRFSTFTFGRPTSLPNETDSEMNPRNTTGDVF